MISRLFNQSIAPILAFAILAGAAQFVQPARGQSSPSIVLMKSFDFSPMTLTVPAGTRVTWKNLDGAPHTVWSADGRFRSMALEHNDSFTFKFDKPGTYKYICSIHPKMTAAIIVK